MATMPRNNRVRINGSGGVTLNLGMLPTTELDRLQDAVAAERRQRVAHHGAMTRDELDHEPLDEPSRP